jgi:threonine aldolase
VASTKDQRSDTVTQPSPAMRRAIAAARVGDDFYQEDPTVHELEARLAALMGKEASLFVPSGTMGNLLGVLVHCPAGGEVIGPEPAHTFSAEAGGIARIAGAMPRMVPQREGELALDRIEASLFRGTVLRGPTRLLWVEQPTRGYPVALADLAGLRELADRWGVPIHMDGARIFNAALALGVEPARLASFADTVLVCISKGLGAPIGSLLAGPRRIIEQARLLRQVLGGGMRQAGIAAAAGIYALEHNVQRLADDHRRAATLADGIRDIAGLEVDRERVETNIFYASVTDGRDPTAVVGALASDGLLVNPPAQGRSALRFVTNLGLRQTDVPRAVATVRRALASIDR